MSPPPSPPGTAATAPDASTPPTGVALSPADRVRLGEIRSTKRTATLVLLGATLLFVAAHLLETRVDDGWGYLRAAMEAAMVGGLADWFAVTALFRHPMGIPIPHTAILPNRKDQLGRTFGTFVQSSFLSPDVLAERLAQISVARRAGEWLSIPSNAATAAEKAGSVAAMLVEAADDVEVTRLVNAEVVARLKGIDAAPLAAKVLAVMTEEGRHHQLVDAALQGIGELLEDQRASLRGRFDRESPWWVPEAVDDRVFDRIYAAITRFVDEVRHDPGHELRRHLDSRLAEFIVRLHDSPATVRRVNALRDEMLEHPAVERWATEVWHRIGASIATQADLAGSPLRARLTQAATALGHSLLTDPATRARVDGAVLDLVTTGAQRYGAEIAQFVESTVQRWDATETSTRVELLLGRDLQIIRINGSVVGGLAGLAIYTMTRLLG
ncbi:MAG: DUF445 domain-containing protein [Microthrixaceae bacterium]